MASQTINRMDFVFSTRLFWGLIRLFSVSTGERIIIGMQKNRNRISIKGGGQVLVNKGMRDRTAMLIP